jgi:hypothetical protein
MRATLNMPSILRCHSYRGSENEGHDLITGSGDTDIDVDIAAAHF